MNCIRFARLMLLCFMLIATTSAPFQVASSTSQRRTADARQRLAPPESITCDRNALTVYSGRVTAYSRTRTRTTLTVATDWDTTERVTLRHLRGRKPSREFLYEGRRFTAADWSRIESTTGKLRAGVRANVWVCDDSRSNPIVDWQGAAEPAPPATSLKAGTTPDTLSR